ncbi:MAG: hypothetical protein F4218_09070 [Synechococcus sp. SB0677_bin_5]|nr:hypothetical protein [Synechococcus sp. SB0677_bin_5]
MAAAVNFALVHKYNQAAVQAAADGKDFLVQRYDGWSDAHLQAALVLLVVGRLLLGWLADRLYHHYARWRVNRSLPSGQAIRRLGGDTGSSVHCTLDHLPCPPVRP